jgi:hypothetical protein
MAQLAYLLASLSPVAAHPASTGCCSNSLLASVHAYASQEQLSSCTNLYVEEQLMGHFPMLLEFVKKAEQQQKRLAIPEGQAIPNFAPPQVSQRLMLC